MSLIDLVNIISPQPGLFKCNITHNITNSTNIIDIAKNRELVKLVFVLMSGIINNIKVVKEEKIDKCSFTYMPTISKITDNFIIEIDFTTKINSENSCTLTGNCPEKSISNNKKEILKITNMELTINIKNNCCYIDSSIYIDPTKHNKFMINIAQDFIKILIVNLMKYIINK